MNYKAHRSAGGTRLSYLVNACIGPLFASLLVVAVVIAINHISQL
jgi:hypothetical protein